MFLRKNSDGKRNAYGGSEQDEVDPKLGVENLKRPLKLLFFCLDQEWARDCRPITIPTAHHHPQTIARSSVHVQE